MQNTKHNTENTLHHKFYVETQCRRKPQNIFLYVLLQAPTYNLQLFSLTGTHLSQMRTPILSGTNLSQIMRTPILSGTNLSQMRTPILSGTNLSQTMRTPILSGTNLSQIMRTPILCELQLTLAPPYHPEISLKIFLQN
jgi:hypothetical protein